MHLQQHVHSLPCCMQGAVAAVQGQHSIGVRLSQAAMHALHDQLKSALGGQEVDSIQLHQVGVLQGGQSLGLRQQTILHMTAWLLHSRACTHVHCQHC